MVGVLRGHGGVSVLRAGAAGVLCNGGEGVCVRSPQYPVPGDGATAAGGRPREVYAVVSYPGGGETGGGRRRVVLDPGGYGGRPRTAPWMTPWRPSWRRPGCPGNGMAGGTSPMQCRFPRPLGLSLSLEGEGE